MTNQPDIMIARTRTASREIASLNLRIAYLDQARDQLREQRDALVASDAQTTNQKGTTP